MGVRRVVLSFAALLVLAACGGGSTAVPIPGSTVTPDPGSSSLGYAVTSGTNRVQPSTLAYSVYPTDSTAALRTV